MKKISGTVVFVKRIFPTIWFGFLGVSVVSALIDGRFQDPQRLPFLLVPIIMIVLGFFLMKGFVWDLMDEVHDCGDSLRVRRGGDEETIAFTNIMNVSVTTHVSPPRITLRLVNPGRFGNEIAFTPPMFLSFNPFTKHPLADELMVRVDRARARRHS
jgi:hypothetical protein